MTEPAVGQHAEGKESSPATPPAPAHDSEHATTTEHTNTQGGADVESQVQAIQDQLKQIQETIEKDKQALQSIQSNLKEKSIEQAALQSVVSDIDTSRAGIKKQREAADKLVQDSTGIYQHLQAQLNGQLSTEHRQAIDAAIKGVDDEIAAEQSQMDDLRQQILVTEKALAQAKDEAKARDTRFRDAQTQLRQLSALIQKKQGEVATLVAAAKAAGDAGRESDAYLLASDLKRALEELRKVSDPEIETGLVNDLVKAWQEARKAVDAVTEKTAFLEDLKRKLAAAQQKFQPKVQGRQATIQMKFTAAREAAKSPAASTVAQPAASAPMANQAPVPR